MNVASRISFCMTYPIFSPNSLRSLVGFWLAYSYPVSVRFFESSRPDRRFSRVVLPHPEGPTIAVKVLGEKMPVHLLRMPLSMGTFLLLLVMGSFTFSLM